MSGFRAHLAGTADADFESALRAAGWEPGTPADGVVFDAQDPPEGRDAVASLLRAAFVDVRAALVAGAPVVVVVALDDLYGRRSVGGAVAACGLLSGARTAAIEARGVPVGVLGVAEGVPPDRTARWVRRLYEGDGVTGELIRVGAGHLGDVQP